MNNPKISLIAAISENRALGRNNKLLWHISEDMKRFRQLTQGHAVIMGRKTYESIGRLLPERTNIIITRDASYKVEGATICHSVEEAINAAKQKEKDEIFVIGGGQIYEQALKYADRLYLTIVKGDFPADTFFPDYSEFKKVVFRKESGDGNYSYTFMDLNR